MKEKKITFKWFVYAWTPGSNTKTKLRYSKGMQGWKAWDVQCNLCGWESKTGGAIQASVKRSIEDHKLDHQLGFIKVGA